MGLFRKKQKTVLGYHDIEDGNYYIYDKDGFDLVKIDGDIYLHRAYRLKDNDILYVPNGVKILGEVCFYECQAHTIIIPSTVEYINDYAFSRCDNLEELIIPSSVRGISFRAFKGCNHIKKVYLHQSLSHLIGSPFGFDWAIEDCDVVVYNTSSDIERDKRPIVNTNNSYSQTYSYDYEEEDDYVDTRKDDKGLITLLGNAIERRVNIDDLFFMNVFPYSYNDYRWQGGYPRVEYYWFMNTIEVSGVVLAKNIYSYECDRALEQIKDGINDYFKDIIYDVRSEYRGYDKEIRIKTNLQIKLINY